MIQKKGNGLSGGLNVNLVTTNRPKSLNRRYLCLTISFVLLVGVSFIFIAWNLLCDIDTDSTLKLESSEGTLIGDILGLNRTSKSRTGRHTVEVYYEVLCPDSKYFILNQLIPTYKKFYKYIRPILIPYGKAFTKKTPKGGYKFECQHGQIECDGNMLHACAINHVPNEHLLISYIHCLMKSNSWSVEEFEKVGEKCAREYYIDWDTLKICWKSEKGSLLLKSHGESTHALRPAVNFIPTVVVDDSQSYQKDILKDFKSYLCKRVLAKDKLPVCT